MSEYGKFDTEPALEWFALAVKPRFDKSVARLLEFKGFQTFLPLYRKRHQYSSRYKYAELPLFPGYVFCRFDVHRRLPILTTPGVLHVLGVGNSPVPVPEGEIFSLQTAMRAQLPAQPCPYLQTGQRVRIEHGVLAGVEGIVIDFKQGARLVLSVSLLQRSVVLEVDRQMVNLEPVPGPVIGQLPNEALHGSPPARGPESYQGD